MKRMLIAAMVTVFVFGCIPSLNPIYRAKDVVFEPELLGTWSEGDEEEGTWVFARGEGESYTLTVTDEEERVGEFVVHLAEIKGHLFLDLLPGDVDNLELNIMYFYTAIPGHAFAYVKQIGPELQMSFVDADWLSDYLEEHPRSLEHRIEGEYTYLTASTRSLQRFFVKHFEDAFDDFSAMKRIAAENQGE